MLAALRQHHHTSDAPFYIRRLEHETPRQGGQELTRQIVVLHEFGHKGLPHIMEAIEVPLLRVKILDTGINRSQLGERVCCQRASRRLAVFKQECLQVYYLLCHCAVLHIVTTEVVRGVQNTKWPVRE